MLQTHYVLLLCSFKEQLQQHVRVHAMEAVYACWEIEQSLQSLTGIFKQERENKELRKTVQCVVCLLASLFSSYFCKNFRDNLH